MSAYAWVLVIRFSRVSNRCRRSFNRRFRMRSRPSLKRSFAVFIAICTTWFATAYAGPADPFETQRLVPANAALRSDSSGASPCAPVSLETPISLPQMVDIALCNHPQTRESWANAKIQAAQVGQARAAFLPDVSADVSVTHDTSRRAGGGDSSRNSVDLGVSLSYLLFDFGGRAATVESARQALYAANWTHDAALQSVIFNVIDAYYQWSGAQQNVIAAKESERASQASFEASDYRYRVGAATPADSLQAKTAWSQARLTRSRAEGQAANALGVLATAMGLRADAPIKIATPEAAIPSRQTLNDVRSLIDRAKALRPDLAAAEAQVRASEAGVRLARANGLASISLVAGSNINSFASDNRVDSHSVGLAVSIPLFTGFKNTYQIRAAQGAVEAREAQRDALANQVSLDVWKAFYGLQTEFNAYQASLDLVASATRSEEVARGRYRAGVGTFIDWLNAQAALANARYQRIQAQYSWNIARATLAQAVGTLDREGGTPQSASFISEQKP